MDANNCLSFASISVVIASDLMRGTGRFNLAQGLVALATGLGASLSNFVAGFVVQRFDYPTGFMTLAAIAIIAFVFFALLMPETGTQHRTSADLAAVSDGARFEPAINPVRKDQVVPVYLRS